MARHTREHLPDRLRNDTRIVNVNPVSCTLSYQVLPVARPGRDLRVFRDEFWRKVCSRDHRHRQVRIESDLPDRRSNGWKRLEVIGNTPEPRRTAPVSLKHRPEFARQLANL